MLKIFLITWIISTIGIKAYAIKTKTKNIWSNDVVILLSSFSISFLLTLIRLIIDFIFSFI